jgi:hypothetical protein
MTTGTHTLLCHICGEVIASREVAGGRDLPASEAIKWHERAIAHLKKAHVRKYEKKAEASE